jgi:penicillin G amidase
MIIHNGSELWNAVMEISPQTKGFEDASPSGGQNQFIDIEGTGNPHIADQLELHQNFQFKRFPMSREEVLKSAESTRQLRVQ